jgi:hypothetical protein
MSGASSRAPVRARFDRLSDLLLAFRIEQEMIRTGMVQKHRYLWEKANGPVPEGMRLKCLDGDRTNCDPSNWRAVPYALAPRLNGRFGRGYDAAPPELKPTIMAITELEHKARQVLKGGRGRST